MFEFSAEVRPVLHAFLKKLLPYPDNVIAGFIDSDHFSETERQAMEKKLKQERPATMSEPQWQQQHFAFVQDTLQCSHKRRRLEDIAAM